jgi:hypothetical protein
MNLNINSITPASLKAKEVATQEYVDLAAGNARQDAAIALELLDNIASDSKLTAVEKLDVKREWDAIVAERSKQEAQADSFGVSKTAYVSAYSSLSSYITPLLSSMSVTSDINRSTFNNNFKDYYDARLSLLNAISTKTKEIADSKATEEYVDTTGEQVQEFIARAQGFDNFESMVSNYSTLGATIISGGYINTDLIKAKAITTKNISIDDALSINAVTGSFSWGKSNYNDFGTSGCWMGNYPNNGVKTPGFAIGGPNSYIVYDGTDINIVNAKFTEYSVHETTVAYTTPGSYIYQIPPEALSSGSMDIELSGGGGGGGSSGACRDYSPKSGASGGNTVVEIINGSTGEVRQTIVALGGSGGTPAIGKFSAGVRPTKGEDFSAYGGDSLFIGHVGGATTIWKSMNNGPGYDGSGYSTGGGGALGYCTQSDCLSGYGGKAGKYNALLRYDPVGATDYLRITVGAGGAGGTGWNNGGRGAGGAVKITVREVK